MATFTKSLENAISHAFKFASEKKSGDKDGKTGRLNEQEDGKMGQDKIGHLMHDLEVQEPRKAITGSFKINRGDGGRWAHSEQEQLLLGPKWIFRGLFVGPQQTLGRPWQNLDRPSLDPWPQSNFLLHKNVTC